MNARTEKTPDSRRTEPAQSIVRPKVDPEAENGNARRSTLWGEALGWRDSLVEEAYQAVNPSPQCTASEGARESGVRIPPANFAQWRVIEVGRAAVDGLVRRHYLHRWPGVVVCTLGLLNERDVVIGCIIFAMPPRETMRRYDAPLAWELARLFIEDETPKNAETWFIARAIRWIQEHRPDVKCLVSYADPSVGHRGTIYRAGSWIEDGRTDSERKTPRFDYEDENAEDCEVSLFESEDPATGKRYSRRAHVPDGCTFTRVPRISKWRYVYWLDGTHEKRRQAARKSLAPDPRSSGPTKGLAKG